MTNFTVQQFLSKTRKILILNEIKCYEECNFHSNAITFPTHHKQHRNEPLPSTFIVLNEHTLYGIEQNINRSKKIRFYETHKKGSADRKKLQNESKYRRNKSSIRANLERFFPCIRRKNLLLKNLFFRYGT